ncbi:hypothetical protein NUW54_g498 [Trametes sanguinea]|uniref:Uncharacterized protein n=1 Tax=Trametes sanguinea TaxID=158606 RepID=A0ACC1Q909_9APHY|nr:hypothetical protein NUW54_g498 [Trametes sanguinea]
MKLYSESTHLTDFGHASLWPISIYFLTQSKYTRGHPSVFPVHHLAYIPSLPDTLQDFYMKRELIQQIWLLLLDDQFMYTYVHGLLLLHGDGLWCRLFLRFLMYAADYLEKILLACLWYFATCPCPRCHINKDGIIKMGILNDLHCHNWVRQGNLDVLYHIKIARCWLFEDGLPLTSKYMRRILDPLSITPTQSVFSIRLREHSFNFYLLFVPNLMHECKLGIWKSTWIHLLCILYAVSNDKVQELNLQSQHLEGLPSVVLPPMSQSRASSLCETLKPDSRYMLLRLHYHDNDLLLMLLIQCFCPAYKGLLTIKADNAIVLNLSFDLATWHALAKLHKHTSLTVSGLDTATIEGGRSICLFTKNTCAYYITLELPAKDNAACTRRKAVSTKITAGQAPHKRKMYNYTTYKFHSMHDFPPRHSLEVPLPTEDGPLLYMGNPCERYYIADSQRDHEELTVRVSSHPGNLALTDFIVELKNHIFLRLNPESAMIDDCCTAADHTRILICNNHLYSHQVCCVNFTAYDRQHSQDSINPQTHADILLLSPEARKADSDLSAHLYMYARVLKVLHVNVCLVDAPVNVLDNNFGFINPHNIIRGTHLIPTFTHGHTDELLREPIIMCQETLSDRDGQVTDFWFYYINIFADRDMFMRYYASLEDDNNNDNNDGGLPAAHRNAAPHQLDTSAQCSQSPIDAPIKEAHCKEDILRLVPELQRRAQNSALNADNDMEEEELAMLQDDHNSEDKELMANVDVPVDEADEHSDYGEDHTDGHGAGFDGEDDDFGLRNCAPS